MSSKTMAKRSNDSDEAPRRRRFTAEYKAEVVRLATMPGKTAYQVARELGLSPSGVADWVKQAAIDQGPGGSGPLTSEERAELAKLRRENRSLRQERDILQAATALFARRGMS
jgi:transposase